MIGEGFTAENAEGAEEFRILNSGFRISEMGTEEFTAENAEGAEVLLGFGS